MIRQVIHIDREKCSGCGLCANACHEGAIGMADGKAVLLKENFCDGLGDCLPACPEGAISFEMRDVPAYDAVAVAAAKAEKESRAARTAQNAEPAANYLVAEKSTLAQWPCQLKLVPFEAPFYDNADLLIAADCSAFACPTIHRDYMDGRTTLIGCPKLDSPEYSEKLAEIFLRNNIRSITVLRMEVPCCGGLERAVRKALAASGKEIQHRTVILSAKGEEIIPQKSMNFVRINTAEN